jgi:hypothetical protein
MLPDIQDITNSYFANLETINIAHNSTFDDKYWLQVNDRYYLKNLINYTNGQKISRIKYYDWINNETNLSNNIYINNNKEIVSDVPINKINIQIINDMNNKFQEYLNRENEIISIRMEKINKNIKLKIINLKHRLDDWNPLEPNLVNSEVNDLTEIDDKIFLDELNLDINKIEIDNELYETTSQATLSEYSNLTEKSSVSSNKVKLNNVISKFENTVLTYKKEGKINSEQEKYIYDNYINKGIVDASAIELLDEYAESNIEVDFSNDEPLKKNYNATSEKQIFSDEPLKKNYNATSEKQSFSDEQLQRKSKKTKTIVPKLDLETKPKTPRGRPRKT